jgi:hypothetical protein
MMQWAGHLSKKAGRGDLHLHLMVALAVRNVAGKVDIRTELQAVPLSQLCVETVARDQVIGVLL